MEFRSDNKADQAAVPSLDNVKGIEKDPHPVAFDADPSFMAALANETFSDINLAQESLNNRKPSGRFMQPYSHS